MYRREDDIIILYNLFTLIYMPFWFVLFFVYNFEFPPRPYSDPYREYDRETYQLFFFFLIYAVERVLGFTLRINRYVVIICNLITFYLLNRLAGYFFLERRDMPITYWFVFCLVTLAAFLNILIEFSDELKDYLLPFEGTGWLWPGFAGYKYEVACKKYWRAIFRLMAIGFIFSVIYYIVKA